LETLGNLIQKSGAGERFFVCNPLSWARTDYADYEYVGTKPVHVIDVEIGQEVPSQFVMKDGKRWLRILASDVPSVGYRVYEIREGPGQSYSDAAEVDGSQIENQFYRLMVDERGTITNFIDKQHGNRQLADDVNERFINDLGVGTGSLQVENEGPVSVTLLASVDAPLTHTTRITLFRDIERIQIQNEITENFNSVHTWGFGFSLQNPDVYHEEVGAILRARLTSDGGHYSPRNARYDWLTLNHFVDINQDNEFGVTLSNADCYFMKLGKSTVGELDTATPQISVLVGGNDLNGGGVLGDQGGDDYFLQRFALRAHDGYDPVSAMKFAQEHQNPFVTGFIQGGDHYPEESYSFLSLDNPNVLLWALKPADDGLEAGIITRLWNLSNESGEFTLSLDGVGISTALSLTHIETPSGIGNVEDGRLIDLINQQQIKTYAVFPAELPYRPDTSDLETATATPVAGEPTRTEIAVDTTSVPDSATDIPQPSITPPVGANPNGKGCLFGLLSALGSLFE
jgi:alpha-mannosidase